MKQYTFHSDLPPEELRALLQSQAEAISAAHRSGETVNVQYRGERVSIHRVDRVEQDQSGVRKYFNGMVTRLSRNRTYCVANPFCGTIRPDSRGGSLLQGGFVLSGRAYALFGGAGVALVLSALLWPHKLKIQACLAVGALLLAWRFYHAVRAPESVQGSQRILEWIRENLDEVSDPT